MASKAFLSSLLAPTRIRRNQGKRPYCSLSSSHKQLRLCKITPGDWKAPLELDVVISSLEQNPEYCCLSYVWGPPEPTIPIRLNGHSCSVRLNLSYALRRLREQGQDGYLWIDAICINQSNDDEKTEQVAMMGQIFAKAQQVLIWLGESDAHIIHSGDGAVAGASESDLEELSEGVEVLHRLAEGKHVHELSCRGEVVATSYSGSACDARYRLRRGLKCIQAFLDVDWFKRAWTVQEIVLSAGAAVLRGSTCIPWAVVEKACANWQIHLNTCCGGDILSLGLHEFQAVQQIAADVNALSAARSRMAHSQTLHEVLLDFRSRQATDPRDKIYGVLGLQSGDKVARLIPDYTRSIREVLISCALEMMRSQRWLLPLFLDLEHALDDLPSWVPDWTLRTTEPPAVFSGRFEYVRTYDSARGLDGRIELLPHDILSVTAIHAGHVERVSRSRRLMKFMIEQLDLLDDWFSFAHREGQRRRDYVGGGTLEDAMIVSIFAGRYKDSKSVREVLRGDIQEWRDHLVELKCCLREKGPSATIGLHPAVASQNIAALRRRLCITSQGYVGLCPDSAGPGDDVFVLFGGPAPMFMRHCKMKPDGSLGTYVALGHGYLHGLMDGEAVGLGYPVVQVSIR